MLSIMSWRAAMAILAVSFVVYIYVERYRTSRRVRRLGARAPQYPGKWPFGLDIPYNAILKAKKNQMYDFWVKMFEATGCNETKSYTFEWRMMVDQRLLFTSDPENIKAILTGQFADFGKGEQFHEEWKGFLGDSIFTTDGKMWHDSRQLIRPMFMRERVADLDVVESHLSKFLRLLGSGNGGMVQVDQLLSRYTLDAVTDYLFGASAGSLDAPEAQFGKAFDEVQRVQTIMMRMGSPMRHLVPQKSFREGLRVMDRFIEPLITAVLQMSPSELEDKVTKSDTFIHSLARFTRDRKVMRDQLVSLLLAGRDTTAATLSWAFLELARNPHVVERLRAEIEEVVGLQKQPTYDDIKGMKYLTYVINETLRLYPPVPYNLRASLRDTTLPRGGGPDGSLPVGCPKGTMIGYGTIMMHRNRDLYPPISDTFPYDPLIWEPDRWATWQPKAWNFLPFNGGPRICIGQQFAMIEMGYTLIRVFQEFDKMVDYGNSAELQTNILLTPGQGVKVGFVKSTQRKEKS